MNLDNPHIRRVIRQNKTNSLKKYVVCLILYVSPNLINGIIVSKEYYTKYRLRYYTVLSCIRSEINIQYTVRPVMSGIVTNPNV